MNRSLLCVVALGVILFGSIAEGRVGSGRSFGTRGSRGFSSPQGFRSNPYRNYGSPSNAQSPYRQPPPMSAASVPQRGPSFLSSLGAGLAGGFLGSMLFRSMGGGHLPYGGMGGGGIGILEILILAGLLFWLLRMFMSRTQTASISNSSDTGAAALMREAKPYGWSGSSMERSDLSNREDIELGHTPSIENEMAMDLFFKIQGAWASRDLTVVNSSIDTDVRVFLDQEISKLKGSRQINRLDNIAVRKVEVAESWQEGNRYYSTVHFLASLLDYTIKEDTQELIEGSKNTPVKFEEYWTFSKEIDSDNWKLSAIQQI